MIYLYKNIYLYISYLYIYIIYYDIYHCFFNFKIFNSNFSEKISWDLKIPGFVFFVRWDFLPKPPPTIVINIGYLAPGRNDLVQKFLRIGAESVSKLSEFYSKNNYPGDIGFSLGDFLAGINTCFPGSKKISS